jgi:hypothetical protein
MGRFSTFHTDEAAPRLIASLVSNVELFDGRIVGHVWCSPWRLACTPTRTTSSTSTDSLPSGVQPEAFGLHANADITKDLEQSDAVLAALLLTSGGAAVVSTGGSGGGGGAAGDALVAAMVADVLRKLPEDFDVEKAQAKYPVRYEESMNQVRHGGC